MKATIKGNILTLEIPLASEPRPSSTGKTLLAATFSGPVGVDYKGQPLKVQFNAMIPNKG